MWTPATLTKNSSVSKLIGVVPLASKAVDIAANKLPLPAFIQRQAARSLKARIAWGLVPLLGLGAAYWGVQAWRRRRTDEVDPSSRAQKLPLSSDAKAPKDKLDEASWESFPASDPPATSGGKIRPMPVPSDAERAKKLQAS